MNALNALLTAGSEWFLAPFAAWPLVTLVLYSAITGILMAVVFRYTSNQKALGTIVDRSRGNLLAIKLFKDDLPGMFRSVGNVFRYVLLRLWHSIVPVLVMLVPFVLLLTQFALRYEHRPLAVDETAVIELELKEGAWGSYRDVALEAPKSVAVETQALRDDGTRSIYWRVRPTAPVTAPLRWQLGVAPLEKSLVAAQDADRLQVVNRRRAGTGWWDRVLNPGEESLSDFSPVAGIVVHYPHREVPVLGINVPWWATFLIVSIVAALLAQPIVKVRF
jgi:hypothetical protein